MPLGAELRDEPDDGRRRRRVDDGRRDELEHPLGVLARLELLLRVELRKARVVSTGTHGIGGNLPERAHLRVGRGVHVARAKGDADVLVDRHLLVALNEPVALLLVVALSGEGRAEWSARRNQANAAGRSRHDIVRTSGGVDAQRRGGPRGRP